MHRHENVRPQTTETQSQRLLLFRSGSFERLAVPLGLVARLEEIPLSAVEHAGGRKVVQYRNQILPLIVLSSIIEDAPDAISEQADPIQVVVFSNEENTIGLIVDQIVDIVDEAVTMRRPLSPRRGILGSAVVGKKVADFLDLQAIIESTGEKFFGLPENRNLARVLLAESSAFNRGLLRNQLEMSGYEVLEAANASEALLRVERESVQVLVVGGDLLAADPSGMDKVRQRTASARIPVLAVSNNSAEMSARKASGIAFDDHQLRFERQAMLASIARLAQAVQDPGARDKAEDLEKTGELVHA
jgi:two-component system chemotaxis sensor kinase CheA